MRQRIVAVNPGFMKDGESKCELRLDTKLVPVIPPRMAEGSLWLI